MANDYKMSSDWWQSRRNASCWDNCLWERYAPKGAFFFEILILALLSPMQKTTSAADNGLSTTNFITNPKNMRLSFNSLNTHMLIQVYIFGNTVSHHFCVFFLLHLFRLYPFFLLNNRSKLSNIGHVTIVQPHIFSYQGCNIINNIIYQSLWQRYASVSSVWF